MATTVHEGEELVLMDGTKQEVIAKLQSHLKRPGPSQKNNAS